MTTSEQDIDLIIDNLHRSIRFLKQQLRTNEEISDEAIRKEIDEVYKFEIQEIKTIIVSLVRKYKRNKE